MGMLKQEFIIKELLAQRREKNGRRMNLTSLAQAINRGVSERLLMEFFGHSDSRSTRRYSKVQTESLKEVWGSSPETVPASSPGKKPRS